MDRHNHYEAAFEAYLQWHRLGYIAIDESRRSWLGDEPVKNLDFLVFGECGARLLVDVKGRRYPAGSADKPRKVWECWTKEDDIDGLMRWQTQFGAGYRALFVFVYQLLMQDIPDMPGDLWTWRGKKYFLRSVLVDDYQEKMKQRSPKWQTVFVPGADFRDLARPFHFFTHEFYDENVEDDVPF